jgi:hypothetical protein
MLILDWKGYVRLVLAMEIDAEGCEQLVRIAVLDQLLTIISVTLFFIS